MEKASWRVRLHCGSVQIISVFVFFFGFVFCLVFCLGFLGCGLFWVCLLAFVLVFLVVFLSFLCPPFFPAQTGMPMPTTGMPACAHNSLAGISEKSLLSVRICRQVLDLLNSFKILTGILNRMRTLWWSVKKTQQS